jgi:hypothetical protein
MGLLMRFISCEGGIKAILVTKATFPRESGGLLGFLAVLHGLHESPTHNRAGSLYYCHKIGLESDVTSDYLFLVS